MLLVVDVGNTQTHFGVFTDGEDEIAEHWRFATVRESTGDELGAALSNLLALRGTVVRPTSSARSSPRPSRSCPSSGRDGRALPGPRRCWSSARRSGPGCRSGSTTRARSAPTGSSTPSPRTSGSRTRAWWSTSAPRSPTTPCRPPGEYLGGIITPGAEISIDALYERAAKLPKVELAEPRSLIGKSTVDAIRSGIVYGFAGQVEGIVGRLRDELGEDTKVIATGGLARVAGAVHPRDDRRGRRPADADRAAADLGAAIRRTESLEPAGIGTSGVRATVAARIRKPRRAAVVRVLGANSRRRRRAARGSPRTPGRRRSPRGRRRRAARAPASRSASPPRNVAIAPSSRNSATRSSSTCGGRSRSPTARAGRRRAARRRRAAATARRRSSGSARADSPACERQRGAGSAADTAVCRRARRRRTGSGPAARARTA